MCEEQKQLAKLTHFVRKYDIFCYPEGHISCFSSKAIEIISKNYNADLLGQYHEQDFRIKYFPFLKLSTGSYFLRKN